MGRKKVDEKSKLAVDIASTIDENTMMKMIQYYMLGNGIKELHASLVMGGFGKDILGVDNGQRGTVGLEYYYIPFDDTLINDFKRVMKEFYDGEGGELRDGES